LFAVAPFGYRKILMALRHMRKGETLLSHYIKTQGHLIGPGVEIWEFDDKIGHVIRCCELTANSIHEVDLAAQAK
jgi:hypothetical protein